MFFRRKKKSSIWKWLFGSCLIVVISFAIFSYYALRDFDLATVIDNDFVEEVIRAELSEDQGEILDILPIVLGFTEPKTYLFLFQNNTELRPGGGFIGVYAVVEVDRGSMEIVEVEGSGILDKRASKDLLQPPPEPVGEYLGVDRWYFRDSNWSPDFEESAKKALEFYKIEDGVKANEIDVVVGITPTVLERLMKITGDFTIEGVDFTTESVTETLEYEVEYGYKEKGIVFEERKAIIRPFMEALVKRVKDTLFENYEKYFDTLLDLAHEKHLVFFSKTDDLQFLLDQFDLSANVFDTEGDYLLWVDANLGALKTDHAMDRTLDYTLSKRPAAHESESDRYLASATMEYDHQGTFDWRTSRYLTYARVYVPKGSKLVSVVGKKKNGQDIKLEEVDSGEELGKQWFGTYFSVEPGNKKLLSFIYQLPSNIKENIDSNNYNLTIQKQLGTVDHRLTLHLDFGKLIQSANPAESEEKWGDTTYEYEGDLRLDREFNISF